MSIHNTRFELLNSEKTANKGENMAKKGSIAAGIFIAVLILNSGCATTANFHAPATYYKIHGIANSENPIEMKIETVP